MGTFHAELTASLVSRVRLCLLTIEPKVYRNYSLGITVNAYPAGVSRLGIPFVYPAKPKRKSKSPMALMYLGPLCLGRRLRATLNNLWL